MQKQVPFKMRKSQDLQVVRYFGQLTLSIFKSYIHDKDIQIITQNANPVNSWDNVYTITYKDSYFPFQWEVYPLVCYMKDPAHLWNEKVTRLASGDKFEWQLNAKKKLTKICKNLDLPSSCNITKVVGMLPLRNPPVKSNTVNFLAALIHQEEI